MIRSLLVCTDGSLYGDGACRFAFSLAKVLKARVKVLHVLDSRTLEGPLMADVSGWFGAAPFSAQLPRFRELMKEKGEAVLGAAVEAGRAAGIEVEPVLREGVPWKMILEEEASAELVILGRHGEHAGWAGESMAGSTTDRVARRALKPCLVTSEDGGAAVKKILVAFDGSGHAGRALHEAIELALALVVPLVILSVAEHNDLKRAHEVADEGIKLARAHECAAGTLVLAGRPERDIPDKAADLGCSLVIAGSHGHNRIREMILGGAAAALLARCPLPLMLVR